MSIEKWGEKVDKTAKRLKARRKLLKASEKKQQENTILQEFENRCKEHNVTIERSRREILRAYKEVQTDCLKKSMLICSVCTLYVLRKLYGYGKTRLYRMAVEFTVRIGDVGQAERNISQMSEDLRLDAGLDCTAEWKDWATPETKGNPNEIDAILKSIPQTLPIIMYAVHISLGFKKRRMERVYQNACICIKCALISDTIKPYLRELEKIGLKIDERGRYMAQGKGIDKEHNKYMKRTGGYKNAKNDIRNFN